MFSNIYVIIKNGNKQKYFYEQYGNSKLTELKILANFKLILTYRGKWVKLIKTSYW